MDTTKKIAVLFDLDGVILDTETQYTVLWDEQGRKHLNREGFGREIKGQTLVQIFDKYFPGMNEVHQQIRRECAIFESEMTYDYIPGAQAFIQELHQHGVKMAIVTSSDEEKMKNVHRSHPELIEQFDQILTAAMFARSKPAPDCFLLGMELFGTTPAHTFVFEDSFHGLQAGMDSGATVIGLATTNSREAIEGKAHYLINDFIGITYQTLLCWGER